MASTVSPSTGSINKSFSQIIDGFRVPGMFSVDLYRSALSYRPRDDDLFVATYPKCGTTWAQYILLLIYRQGQPIDNFATLMQQSPYLEFTGAKGAEDMPRPGAIKVHLPYHLTPRSDKAKYIYVTRNPKDCLVSFYHHMKNVPGHVLEGSFDDFFEMFISGEIDYGDYFDHLLGWYEHRNDPNVLFMTYEEMKADTKAAILQMASFVDDEKYAEPLRNDPHKLDNVVRYSSFDHMKGEVNKSMDSMFSMSKEEILEADIPASMKAVFVRLAGASEGRRLAEEPKKDQFLRKGVVGDWKSHLSPEQSKRMEEKFAEKTKHTDIPSFWKNIM